MDLFETRVYCYMLFCTFRVLFFVCFVFAIFVRRFVFTIVFYRRSSVIKKIFCSPNWNNTNNFVNVNNNGAANDDYAAYARSVCP